MLEFQRTSLSLPSLLQSPEYFSLIHPSSLPHLTHLSSATYWIAIEARLGGELVGLSLSEVYPLLKIAQLHSIVIKSNRRHQGMGRQLFTFTEDQLVKEEKIQTVELMYEQTDPSTPALEKIMASLGWPIPQLLMIRCHFDAHAFNPP